MSIFAIMHLKAVASPGRWRLLIAVLTAVAIAAVVVLAALLIGLSQPPGDGRIPHPEPAPAPVPQR
jgi:hypothetical protein